MAGVYREVRRDVVRIGRVVEVRQVAGHAGGAGQAVVIADVAVGAPAAACRPVRVKPVVVWLNVPSVRGAPCRGSSAAAVVVPLPLREPPGSSHCCNRSDGTRRVVFVIV